MRSTTATPTQLHITNSTRARRIVTVLVAVVGALAVRAIAGPALGVDVSVTTGPGRAPMAIGFGAVTATSLAAALAGWASLAIVERFSDRARTLWATTATVVLLASLVPVAMVEASGAATATLALLHLVVAAVLIPGLTRSLSRFPHGGRS